MKDVCPLGYTPKSYPDVLILKVLVWKRVFFALNRHRFSDLMHGCAAHHPPMSHVKTRLNRKPQEFRVEVSEVEGKRVLESFGTEEKGAWVMC